MHCRFCHNRGHNRNSCPEVKSYAAEAHQIMSVEGKQEYELGYRHRYALMIERNKAQISANAKAKTESAKAQGLTNSRKCSYCENMGHTRVKCAVLLRIGLRSFSTRLVSVMLSPFGLLIAVSVLVP